MEKTKYWKLEVFESWVIFSSIQNLCDSLSCDLEDIENPENIIIAPIFMTESEFNKLPEFEGY